MSLKVFRIGVVTELLHKNRTPQARSNENEASVKIKAPVAPRPPDSVRYDNVGHLPIFVSQGQCKNFKKKTESVSWKFGRNDDPAYKVLDQKTGRIGPFEYQKTVVFDIPDCTEIKYVQVEIHNQLNAPSVSFESGNNSVPIIYKPMDDTMSTYDIIAKGSEIEDCLLKVSENEKEVSTLEEIGKELNKGRGPKKPWVSGGERQADWEPILRSWA